MVFHTDNKTMRKKAQWSMVGFFKLVYNNIKFNNFNLQIKEFEIGEILSRLFVQQLNHFSTDFPTEKQLSETRIISLKII